MILLVYLGQIGICENILAAPNGGESILNYKSQEICITHVIDFEIHYGNTFHIN